MRIAIDGRVCAKRRGMGNYTANLLRELAALPNNFELIVYVNNADAADAIPRHERIAVRVLNGGPYPIWEQLALPRAVRRDKIDLLHSPANTGPLYIPRGTRHVMTIHDVMFLLPLPSSPSLYQRLGRKYYALASRQVAPKADCVITVSEFSASDIRQHLKIKPERLRVTHEAASVAAIDPAAAAAARAAIGCPADYVLTIGAVDPRKNTDRVLRVYGELVKAGRIDLPLVMTGVEERWQSFYAERCRALGIEARVQILGFMPEEKLAALYAGARVFLYPSLYEGFGLPVLEAMNAGCPTITSNTTSIPEIAGDAALLVTPTDNAAIAGALQKVLGDSALAADLRARGKAQAARFSWRKMAQETAAIYEEILRP